MGFSALHCLVSNCIFYPKVNNDVAVRMLAGVSPDDLILSRSAVTVRCVHIRLQTLALTIRYSWDAWERRCPMIHPGLVWGWVVFFLWAAGSSFILSAVEGVGTNQKLFRIGRVLCGGGGRLSPAWALLSIFDNSLCPAGCCRLAPLQKTVHPGAGGDKWRGR